MGFGISTPNKTDTQADNTFDYKAYALKSLNAEFAAALIDVKQIKKPDDRDEIIKAHAFNIYTLTKLWPQAEPLVRSQLLFLTTAWDPVSKQVALGLYNEYLRLKFAENAIS